MAVQITDEDVRTATDVALAFDADSADDKIRVALEAVVPGIVARELRARAEGFAGLDPEDAEDMIVNTLLDRADEIEREAGART